MKKVYLVLALISFIFFTGCGKQNNVAPTVPPPETITIGYIAMNGSSPQALINREKKLFEKAFEEAGYNVEWVITRGRDNVGPLMEEGKFHFLYTPINNFTAYFTKTSQFAGGDNYRIIAGSQAVEESSILLVNENISGLSDLDGKTIGIVNNSYSHEMLLNLQLAKEGLSTEIVGGTVNIQFQDYLVRLYEKFENGEFDGIIARRSEEDFLAERFPNAKKLLGLNNGDVVGGLVPSGWLYARDDVLENWPDLVTIMLETHIDATALAEANKAALPQLALDTLEYYYYEVAKVSEYEQPSIEEVTKEWNRIYITYDPNEAFVKELHTFVFKSGYTDKPYEEFANFGPLNAILKN